MLKPNTLYLYQLNIKNLPQTPPCKLTLFETNKLSRLPKHKQSTYQQMRFMIRHILAQHHISNTDFHITESGQPKLLAGKSISLSHSQDIWLIGVMAANSLGIDIQLTQPQNLPALLKRFNLTETLSAETFLSYWTLVEAYCKCTQSPILSTMKTPIETQLSQNNLYHISQSLPQAFSAVSTSPIEDIIYLDEKNL